MGGGDKGGGEGKEEWEDEEERNEGWDRSGEGGCGFGGGRRGRERGGLWVWWVGGDGLVTGG